MTHRKRSSEDALPPTKAAAVEPDRDAQLLTAARIASCDPQLRRVLQADYTGTSDLLDYIFMYTTAEYWLAGSGQQRGPGVEHLLDLLPAYLRDPAAECTLGMFRHRCDDQWCKCDLYQVICFSIIDRAATQPACCLVFYGKEPPADYREVLLDAAKLLAGKVMQRCSIAAATAAAEAAKATRAAEQAAADHREALALYNALFDDDSSDE